MPQVMENIRHPRRFSLFWRENGANPEKLRRRRPRCARQCEKIEKK
ncbi:hypothetical protein [Lachnoclostridium sp. An14]|nr:hypothetical protein [Lachnoclostridium sp. An14]